MRLVRDLARELAKQVEEYTSAYEPEDQVGYYHSIPSIVPAVAAAEVDVVGVVVIPVDIVVAVAKVASTATVIADTLAVAVAATVGERLCMKILPPCSSLSGP